MLIIGIGHKARNGKDTAAEAIKNYFDEQTRSRRKHVASYKGLQVGIFKYATALYSEVEKLIETFGMNDVFSGKFKLPLPTYQGFPVNPTEEAVVPMFDTITIPSWVTSGDPTPAPVAKYGKHPKLLQWWGTEFRRKHYGQDYWVKKTFESIPTNLDIAIVSDMRFLNEADAIKQRGGYTVNVQRLNRDGSQYFSSDRPVDHPSEIELDNYNYDYFIKIKDGDQALIQEQAVTLAEYLRARQ